MNLLTITIIAVLSLAANGQKLRALSEFGGDDPAMSIMRVVRDAAAGEIGSKSVKAELALSTTSMNSKSSEGSKSSKSSQGVKPVTATGPSPPAPFCLEVGAACSSGNLLEGRGITEKNTFSDTIDGCQDGIGSSKDIEISVERITVSGVDGQALQAGGNAMIEAVVLYNCLVACIGFPAHAHFFYSDTVNTQFDPGWTHIGLRTAVPSGLHRLEMEFPLNGSGLKAVRVNFGFIGEGSCADDSSGEGFSDHDDLVFSVAKEGTW